MTTAVQGGRGTDVADHRVEVNGPAISGAKAILTPSAVEFVALLERRFGSRRRALLDRRREVQARLDAGWKPDFLPETTEIRRGSWMAAPIPADLQDRRVEITGPVDRKMIINALNSGANVFMADFEDSCAPTWKNLIEGQQNLHRRRRAHDRVRLPRGQGLPVERARRDAHGPARAAGTSRRSTSLVDGAARLGQPLRLRPLLLPQRARLLARGTGPYFYLPKMESHLEARLWNDVFRTAQEELKLPRGTIHATVLIETILAAFEMDEILYELRDHSAGLNCGRWDYIFSFIKKFRERSDCVLPDRALVTMARRFLRVLHAAPDPDVPPARHPRDGRHGGADPDQGRRRSQRTRRSQKVARRQAARGARRPRRHVGRAPGPRPHRAPDLRRASCRSPNQIDRRQEPERITAADLLEVPDGADTEAGLRHNIRVGVPVPRGLAARLGLRAALQPDGGRRDRRDLARAGLAVAAPRSRPGRRAAADARAVRKSPRRGARRHPQPGGRRCLARRALRATRASSSTQLATAPVASRIF